MATYVGKIKVDGTNELPIGSTLYGTCGTAAATAAKVVTMANFDQLITGVTIHVKFTYSNTVANPTLNVNSTGAKTIYRYGTTAPSTSAATSWNAGAVVSFTYDGTYWQMNDWLNTDTPDSTKLPLAGGTMTGTITLAATGLSTNSADGYTTDSSGNLVHKANSAAHYFHLDSYDKSKKLTYYWETGNVAVPGTITTNGKTVATVPTTATASLTVASWSGTTQTVTVSGVTASNLVIVSPAPASVAEWGSCGVDCSAQAANKLTVTCSKKPAAALTANVVIMS